jgi:hypothetical protein
MLLTIVLSSAACTPTRSFDTDVAYGWANAQFDREAAHHPLGLAVVGTNGTMSSDETGFTLAQPSTVTDLRARCQGGATIRIEARVTGETEHATARGLLVCDERDHLIDLAAAAGFAATSVSVWAMSGVETAALVVLEGAASSRDVWDGYFSDELQQSSQDAYSAYAGSFGAPGSATVVQDLDDSTPAGHHLVEVTCAGDARLTVTLSDATDSGAGPQTASAVTDLECPVTALLELTTEQPGLSTRLDSHGSPGAYLVRVDPDGFSVEP